LSASRNHIESRLAASREVTDCAVPVLYLILRLLEDLAVSGGSDSA
jgi:hypothetical protein